MSLKHFIWNIWRIALSFWYFKLLGRKRDRSKHHDCKYFEESGVNIMKYLRRDADGNPFIDEKSYDNALMAAKNKRIGRGRDCCGDGHYKCYECMNLDYINSDLIH